MTTAPQAVNNVVTLNTDINNGNVAALNSVMMLESYKGVKFSLEMKMTYNLILSFTRQGKKSEFSQSYLSAYLSCSQSTTKRAVANLKSLGLIQADPEQRGRGDVDLLEALPIEVDHVVKAEVKRINNRKSSKGQQNASRPTAKRKPAPATMENQEQSNNVVSLDTGKPIQHCDPVPVNTDVNTTDDLEMYTQIADSFGVKYNLAEIMHMCRGDRVKAAKRLKGEIDTFHFNAKQSEQQPAQLVIDCDYDLDDETADEAGYAF
ncbi:hypothetical protein [Serratia fonticola]|uniref:hypothetical protein n=1 Tax=Serratia fonticola TaxID=47917 RepID=UPI0027F652BE|nr:hypothetical protein [Serratia fonticola]MDQ7209774.1 hypothetical protein [Serratia fonticola]HBE9079144.1 hypothetical protein [Serratia fonticola]